MSRGERRDFCVVPAAAVDRGGQGLGVVLVGLDQSKTSRTSASSALSSLPWSIWELSRTIAACPLTSASRSAPGGIGAQLDEVDLASVVLDDPLPFVVRRCAPRSPIV